MLDDQKKSRFSLLSAFVCLRLYKFRCAYALLGGVLILLTSCAVLQQGQGKEPQKPSPWHIADTPNRSLDHAPESQHFIAPGIEGIFAELRKSPVEAEPAANSLKPYTPYEHLDTPPDPKRFNLRQIVFKLVQGSDLRLIEGRLAPASEGTTQEQLQRLERSGISQKELLRDIDTFHLALKDVGAKLGSAAPQLVETDLQRLHQRAEKVTRHEQPDPNLFYFIHLPAHLQPLEAASLLKVVRSLRSIETSYFQPIPFDAQQIDRPPLTTIDVTNDQNYFRPAPRGIDVDLASRLPGGNGVGVRIADIEAGWTDTHEDLPTMAFRFGVNWGSDHGTAVLGQIAAGVNGFGANGIAPAAQIGWSSITNLNLFPGPIYFYSVGNALLMTGYVLRAGDIALIEQHFPNLIAGACPNTCNCEQFGYVAVETAPYEHMAISLLTAAGVIVIEAAGNGQTLVSPASSRDSGAIVVGASSNNLSPACFTNFGPRVNVHAWGQSIGTLGYGKSPGLRANNDDATQWYTRSFGGTSGASPIVVGAAALIQSTRMASGLSRLTPLQMRTLLVSTGTPQTSGVAIGPMPDLARALATFIPDAARFVSQAGAPLTAVPGATFSLSTQFENTGSARWIGTHLMSVAPSFDTGQQDFLGPVLSQGSSTTPVNPGDRVTGPMQIQAPAKPGTYFLTIQLVAPGGVVLARSPAKSVVVAQPNTPINNASISVDSAPFSLRNGQTGSVTVTATNIGTSTWTSQTTLQLFRSRRISMPQFSKPVIGSVAPGQSQSFTFEIICNGQGSGGFSVRMFGQIAGGNVVCQP